MKSLSSTWWDRILDGQVYEVDVRETGYRGVNAFRCAAYQQADVRFCLAATHKSSAFTLVVQAWGGTGLPAKMPRLEGVRATPAPSLPSTPSPHRSQPSTPVSAWASVAHSPIPVGDVSVPQPARPSIDYNTIKRPAGTQEFAQPTPQEQPPTMTVEPTQADMEALLGPCTCGNAPTCLPSCERFN